MSDYMERPEHLFLGTTPYPTRNSGHEVEPVASYVITSAPEPGPAPEALDVKDAQRVGDAQKAGVQRKLERAHDAGMIPTDIYKARAAATAAAVTDKDLADMTRDLKEIAVLPRQRTDLMRTVKRLAVSMSVSLLVMVPGAVITKNLIGFGWVADTACVTVIIIGLIGAVITGVAAVSRWDDMTYDEKRILRNQP